MNVPLLQVRTTRDADGTLSVLAPKLGWWSDLPGAGALLGAGSSVGELRQLNRRFCLVLPEGASGRIVDGLPRQRALAVEYGQLLFRLAPVGSVEAGAVHEEAEIFGHGADANLPEGCRAVTSPTDGVFYRRSGPGAAPFVEVGARVRLGQAVGLVEVMKTFNQIAYEGPGFPDEATIEEIRSDDGEEVRSGQVLFVVR